MGIFQGEVLPLADFIAQAKAAEPLGQELYADIGLRHTAQGNAAACASMISAGRSLDECWRFGVLQTLDDYTSTLRRGGTELAQLVFAPEPEPTGAPELDAAFAALAEHLADRDGWMAPQWIFKAERRVHEWFPAVPSIYRQLALDQSPPAFRSRGIFITDTSLARA